MKVGDRIVCIKEYNTIWCMTTLFSIYKVVEVPNRIPDVSANIGIFDDKGEFMRPEWGDFITLKEYRKLKLNKINGSQG